MSQPKPKPKDRIEERYYVHHHQLEGECVWCGWPIDVGDWAYLLVYGDVVCSKRCAQLQIARCAGWEPSPKPTYGVTTPSAMQSTSTPGSWVGGLSSYQPDGGCRHDPCPA